MGKKFDKFCHLKTHESNRRRVETNAKEVGQEDVWYSCPACGSTGVANIGEDDFSLAGPCKH